MGFIRFLASQAIFQFHHKKFTNPKSLKITQTSLFHYNNYGLIFQLFSSPSPSNTKKIIYELSIARRMFGKKVFRCQNKLSLFYVSFSQHCSNIFHKPRIFLRLASNGIKKSPINFRSPKNILHKALK